MIPFSSAELQTARDMLAANPRAGRETLAKLLNCSTKRARNILKVVREAAPGTAIKLSEAGDPGSHVKDGSEPRRPTESDEVCGDKRTITKETSERIKTLADLIRVCEIDTDEWEIERWVANKWEVGAKDAAKRIQVEPLFQVKAWLRRKVSVVAIRCQVEELQRKAESYSPQYPAIIFRDLKASGNMAEISLYDHHFGALIWGKETGEADYDTAIADRCFREAITTLISRVRGFGLDRIMLSLGNDLQNADNRAGTTEAGTVQSMDTRYQRVCGVVQDAAVWAIEACREVAPEVLVPMVYGNHDPVTTFHLGGYLRAWFRNCPGVVIDNEPTQRKFYQHGTVMLMLTHGKDIRMEDYLGLMAVSQPRMWADTTWREAHIGHVHTKRRLVQELEEVKGVTVRVLPSLRPPCSWTSDHGWIGNIRSAEAFVWNDREGLVGTAMYSIAR